MTHKDHAGYMRARRAKMKAQGHPLPSGSDTWSPEKRAAWVMRYYARPDVKARKVAQNRKSIDKHPDRQRARRKVRHEIDSGRMVRGSCEVCRTPNAHAHHDDYAKPLAIRWLCRKHHDEHHHTKAVPR